MAEEELLAAVDAGDTAAVVRLLGEDPGQARARDAEGVSAILHALYRGHPGLVRLLLPKAQPFDVFEAAALGDEQRLRALLDDDPALVSATSGDGFSPLHLAAFFGRLETARLLVARGADVASVASNLMRVMPLHSAAAGRHAAIVALLVEAGAPVDARQAGGFTPLHSAAQNGDAATAAALVAAGADPCAPNDEGVDPRTLARGRGHDGELGRVLGLDPSAP